MDKRSNPVASLFTKDKKYAGFIGVAAIALIAIGVVAYMMFFLPPTKADYQAAGKKLDTAINARDKLNKPYAELMTAIPNEAVKASSSDEAFKALNEKREAYDTAQKTFAAEVEELGNEPAFRNGDAKTAYEDFKDREEKRSAYFNGYISGWTLYNYASKRSCQKVYTAAQSTVGENNIESYAKNYATNNRNLSKECREDLTELSKSSNKPLADLGKGYLSAIDARQKNLDEAAAVAGKDENKSKEFLEKAKDENISIFGKAVDAYIPAQTEARKVNLTDNERKKLDEVLSKLEKETA